MGTRLITNIAAGLCVVLSGVGLAACSPGASPAAQGREVAACKDIPFTPAQPADAFIAVALPRSTVDALMGSGNAVFVRLMKEFVEAGRNYDDEAMTHALNAVVRECHRLGLVTAAPD